jgi:hypothetical protein
VTDDVWVFAEGQIDWEDTLKMMDFVLTSVGLERSTEKTEYIDDPLRALQVVRDHRLSAADAAFAVGNDLGREAVRDIVDVMSVEEVPSLARFRYALNASRRLCDSYVTELLLDRQTLMELDPRAVGEYVSALARNARRLAEPFLQVLESPTTERTQAVHLHLLRAFGLREWGRAEGKIFERLFRDGSLSPATRGFAFLALARAPRSRSASDAVDVAVTNTEPLDVRRAAVLSLRLCQDDKERDRAAVRCAAADGDLAPTAMYTVRAA